MQHCTSAGTVVTAPVVVVVVVAIAQSSAKVHGVSQSVLHNGVPRCMGYPVHLPSLSAIDGKQHITAAVTVITQSVSEKHGFDHSVLHAPMVPTVIWEGRLLQAEPSGPRVKQHGAATKFPELSKLPITRTAKICIKPPALARLFLIVLTERASSPRKSCGGLHVVG